MFVNGIYVLVSISWGIRFTTVEYVPRQTDIVLAKPLDKIYDIYIKHGF